MQGQIEAKNGKSETFCTKKCEIICGYAHFANNAKKKVPVFGLTGMVK
jgi:hypothetical protein